MQKSFIILLFWSLAVLARGQEQDNLSGRFAQQLMVFPHEKIYLQTDKPSYMSGERIWLRSHLVEATTNSPAFLSRYVYIELFDPFDQLQVRVKIRPDSLGVYAGHLDLSEELPQGNYTLRAYTRYMRNQGNEWFFKKNIQILDPFSLNIEPVPLFDVEGDKVAVTFQFKNPDNGEIVIPEVVSLKLVDETARTLSPDKDNQFKWNFKLNGKRDNRNILLGIVYNGRKYNRFYPIPSAPDDFDVTFHPEGGYLISGSTCQVGFKALSSSGLSVDVDGILYDSEDNEILKFRNLKSGMGVFYFMPEVGKTYYALCKSENGQVKRMELPVANESARAVSVRQIGGNRIMISLLKGSAAANDSLFLLIHNKGVVYLHHPWEDPSRPFSFMSNQFPGGILQILLLNSRNEILSERLTFNFSPDDFADISAETPLPVYKPRQKVGLKLHLEDIDSISFADNIAISVTDRNAVLPDTVNSLPATLLLSSELKGFIESPASYFRNGKVADKLSLDALMLTQGWRRYNIPSLLQGQIEQPNEYLPEQFQEITGKADGLLGGLKEANVSLYATLDSLQSGETITADDKGRFMFKVEYPEGTEITIQSLSKKGGKHNLINIDPETFPDNEFATLPYDEQSGDEKEEDLTAYLQKANEEYTRKFGIRTIMLEEVTVTAKKLESYKESSYYSPLYATGVVTSEDIEKRKYSSFRSLLQSTPGVIVQGNKVTTTQSDSPVMFIIDDLPREDFADQIDVLSVDDIDNLFVVKSDVGLLGFFPDTEGAVVITTKRGFVQKNVKSINIDRIKPLGYQLPAEFYSPKYETPEELSVLESDLRTTIYWKPNVQFTEDGMAEIEFYTADAPSTYQIVGEGVTSSGKMIRIEKEITVESLIKEGRE